MEKASLKSENIQAVVVEDGSSSEKDYQPDGGIVEFLGDKKDYKSGGGTVEFFDDKKDTEVYSSTREVNGEQAIALFRRLGYKNPEDISDIPSDIEYVLDKIGTMTPEHAVEVMKEAAVYHEEDRNITDRELNDYRRLSELDPLLLSPQDEDYYDLMAVAGLIEWHSPYEYVRACVDPRDDPDLPVETLRAYILSFFWVIVGCGVNELFSERFPSIEIPTDMVQMLLFPMGNIWAKFMPYWSFPIWKNKRIHLNLPQPWNYKEQMFATILYSVGGSTLMTDWNILTKKMYYHESVSFGYQFFLSLGVQYMGLGFAGILRRFVVYPAWAIWPTDLQTIALNKALFSREEEKNSDRRFKSQTFFFICFGLLFFYQWVPSFLFQALSTFNWMTWISPNNFNLAAITGSQSGVGFNPIATFDWNVIGGSSLTIPLFSTMNSYVGSIVGALCVIAIFYSNRYHTQYLPIFDYELYTNTAELYDITQILDKDHKVDVKKYQRYSPPYYTAGNILSYGSSIAAYPMTIAYFLIAEWKIMYRAFKEWTLAIWSLRKKDTWVHVLKGDAHALDEFNDPHSRMMRHYKEVPDWWFFVVLICSIGVGIGTIEGYHTGVPVWSFFMVIGINIAFLIPIDILAATTGNTIALNIFIEVIVGYALPGNPHALLINKAFGTMIDSQADTYVGNLKIGHYAKIPPKALFRGQMIVLLIGIFVDLGVLNWTMDNIKDFCSRHQEAKFTCRSARTYYNASVIWGAIGPKRIFEGVYPIMKWCWLIGACAGIGFGLYKLFFPRYLPRWFHPLIFAYGMTNIDPSSGGLTYITPGAIGNFISQFYFRHCKRRVWERYNYVLAAGFDAGVAVASIIIFFAVQYKPVSLNWWGNNVMNVGVDGNGPALKNISSTQKGYFGPGPGHYP